jgi:hypothetical protein
MTAWERCDGRCAVAGPRVQRGASRRGKARRPYAPSLDRIDPRRGYEPDNVRLVCAVANFAMNAWGLEPVLYMARAMAKKHAEETGDPGHHLQDSLFNIHCNLCGKERVRRQFLSLRQSQQSGHSFSRSRHRREARRTGASPAIYPNQARRPPGLFQAVFRLSLPTFSDATEPRPFWYGY